MEDFTYNIQKINLHEATINVLYTPNAADALAGAVPWLSKVSFVVANFDAAPDKDEYFKGIITVSVPTVQWAIQKELAVTSIIATIGVDVPVTIVPPPVIPPFTGIDKLNAIFRMNFEAGETRRRNLAAGGLIGFEHGESIIQAQAFKDGGYLGVAPPMVQTSADAFTVSTTVAADTILANGVAFISMMEQVREVRLIGERDINAALLVDVPALLVAILADLEAI